MQERRLSRYLHRPWLLLFFESQEWTVIFFSVAIAFIGQGWWYLGILGFPMLIIPQLRKLPRGSIQHWLSQFGWKGVLQGYPPLYEREFNE